MSLNRFNEVIFLLIILLLFFLGFLNPKFLKTPQLSIDSKAIQNNFSNPIINIDRLNQFHSSNNYLSSDQFEDKNVVFDWSKIILNYAKNNIPIPRMYFPYIPKILVNTKQIRRNLFSRLFYFLLP